MPTSEQLAAARALRPGDPVIAMRSDGETLWVTYESGNVCTLGDPTTRAEASFERPFQDGESKLTPEMLAQELARMYAQVQRDQSQAQQAQDQANRAERRRQQRKQQQQGDGQRQASGSQGQGKQQQSQRQTDADRWALAEARHFEARLAGRATQFCDIDQFLGALWCRGDAGCSGDALVQIIAQNREPYGFCAKHAQAYVVYFGASHLDAD